MKRISCQNGPQWLGFQLLLLCLVALYPSSTTVWAAEYTPDSDEVRQLVARGVDFLSKNGRGHGEGYDILIGYTIYKATEDPDHEIVKHALTLAQRVARAEIEGDLEVRHEFNYILSVAAQLMAAVDPVKYKSDLNAIVTFYKNRQKTTGSFGYKHSPYENLGDTSQTQYVLLALWSMDHADIEVPPEITEQAFQWLRSTQFGDGGFAYQFPNDGRQPDHVMTAVGMSAAMIAGDLMGALRPGGGSAVDGLDEMQEYGVPVAFRRVIEDKKGKSGAANRGAIISTAESADRWINARPYMRNPGFNWHYYYLYSIERYQAFMEAMRGKREKSPTWYNDAVEELKRNQDEAGAWGRKDKDAGSIESCTCFAILFLLRTTQKSIGELSEAVLTGGQGGLQADMSAVEVKSGKVEDTTEITDLDQAMAMLDKAATIDDDQLARRIKLDSDAAKRREQLERFARMVRNGGTAATRRLAAKVLCRGDNLDFVPDLIFALTDPDPLVNQYAENSLRVLSRQLDTYKIPAETQNDSFSEDVRKQAVEHWRKWYLTVRPDYIFLDNEF